VLSSSGLGMRQLIFLGLLWQCTHWRWATHGDMRVRGTLPGLACGSSSSVGLLWQCVHYRRCCPHRGLIGTRNGYARGVAGGDSGRAAAECGLVVTACWLRADMRRVGGTTASGGSGCDVAGVVAYTTSALHLLFSPLATRICTVLRRRRGGGAGVVCVACQRTARSWHQGGAAG
jgi:hypothetical protein